MSDVIETLARALRKAYESADIPKPDAATTLLAQIAPTLRAEGMEMAALSLREWQSALIQMRYSESAITVGMAADVVQSEAKDMRAGSRRKEYRCDACMAVGMIHCAHPDECGNMEEVESA